jgi:serine/threonine protein kinase
MNSEHSERPYDPLQLREIFAAALELDRAERGRFLDVRCAGLPELRSAVERLLRADADAASQTLWQFPAVYAEARHMAIEESLPFDRLGPYSILARIGTGGMGAVYLAQRDYDDVRRQVALKVIPRVFLDDDIIRRFRQERQILARMEHPNIAGMLDAGTTADGAPYLVMEYIDGVPIDEYCAAHSLPLRTRLALFERICDAVAYAHRNLVVHRDLKPRNILVTADGVPKLLDFGIAKLLSETSDPEATSAAMMTPGYASPEQLTGGAITTASDIYSLGVILHELLANERISTPRRRLQGDMENVVAMALRSEPERRYGSVGDFAADARRAAEGYPVRARPDTLRYRVHRFVARRPVETLVVLALAAALVVAASVAFAQYRSATERFDQVRGIANSFLFEVYDAIADLPGTTRARMIVARRAQQYLDVLSREHSSELSLRRELAASYRKLGDILGKPFAPNLGDTEGALDNYRKAAAVLQSMDAAGHADAALLSEWGKICSLEAFIAIRHDRPAEAVSVGEKSVALFERAAALQPASPDAQYALLNGRLSLAMAHQELGNALNDVTHLETAASLDDRVLAAVRKIGTEAPADERWPGLLGKACEYLAYAESDLAKRTGDRAYYGRSLRHLQEQLAVVRELYRRNPDRNRRRLADALADLSRAWLENGDARQSEEAARESLRGFMEIAAPDPSNVEAARDVFVGHWLLGRALDAQHRFPEAATEFEKVLSMYAWIHERNPADHPLQVVAEARDRLAAYRISAGDREAALALYRANIAMLSESKGVVERIMLALDCGLAGDAIALTNKERAKVDYRQAAVLWENLRDSRQLPAQYADKPQSMRQAASP